MDDFNPFAAFAFQASTATKPQHESPITKETVLDTKESHDPLCLWSGIDHFASASSGNSSVPPSQVPIRNQQHNKELSEKNETIECKHERYLKEYTLIKDFRENGPRSMLSLATVDEFNRFLLTLYGSTGRYFALVVCRIETYLYM